MAKMEWKAPIDAVHGKLYKGFGAAKRKSANAAGEQPNFSVFYGTRKTTVAQSERNRWTRFGAIAKAVALRRKDITKRATDLANFKAQTAKKTMTEYLWSVCTTEYNTAHPES